MSLPAAFASSAAFFSSVKEFDATVFDNRLFCWKRTILFIFRGQIPGRDLAGFDIGLVESINPDDGSGNGGGDFPAKEFRAEIVRVGHRDSNHRLSGLLECGHFLFLALIDARLQPHINENAVTAVNIRRGKASRDRRG